MNSAGGAREPVRRADGHERGGARESVGRADGHERGGACELVGRADEINFVAAAKRGAVTVEREEHE